MSQNTRQIRWSYLREHLQGSTPMLPSKFESIWIEGVIYLNLYISQFLISILRKEIFSPRVCPFPRSLTLWDWRIASHLKFIFNLISQNPKLPFGEGRNDEPAGVAEVLEPVLQVGVDHLHPHRLVFKVVSERYTYICRSLQIYLVRLPLTFLVFANAPIQQRLINFYWILLYAYVQSWNSDFRECAFYINTYIQSMHIWIYLASKICIYCKLTSINI